MWSRLALQKDQRKYRVALILLTVNIFSTVWHSFWAHTEAIARSTPCIITRHLVLLILRWYNCQFLVGTPVLSRSNAGKRIKKADAAECSSESRTMLSWRCIANVAQKGTTQFDCIGMDPMYLVFCSSWFQTRRWRMLCPSSVTLTDGSFHC